MFHIGFSFFLFPPAYRFDIQKVTALILGLMTIIIQVQLIKFLSFGRKRVSCFLTLFLFLFYAFLYVFYYTQKTAMDFSLIYENFQLLWYKESLQSILSNLPMAFLFYGIFLAIIFYILEQRYHLFSEVYCQKKRGGLTLLLLFFSNIFLLVTPGNSNMIAQMYQSIQYFYTKKSINVTGKKYPYINTNILSNQFQKQKNKPYVFLIFMESYSGLYTDKKAKNGKIITPYFNQLKKRGYYVENFYGHSIQTAKGQFGTLSGIYPSIYSKVFTTYGNLNLYALPAILRDNGYETVFTKAYKSLDFDNTRYYAEKLGFTYIDTLGSKKYIVKEDKPYMWGWGLQDDKYYTKFFQHLDTIHEENISKSIFATLTTVSNHMMFDKIPSNQKYLYPNANTNYTNYMNSMYLSDKYLKTFFEELEKRGYLNNAIVIITGDHSWPSGEHGYWHNETSFYEEFFKIPLLILWKGKLAPAMSGIPSSQIDIAPTILDMLQIQSKNHFVGKSIFQKRTEEAILTVQPYSGTYLTAKKESIKYVKHLQTQKEYLFDFKKDPKESSNLIQNKSYAEITKSLKSATQKLIINEQLIRENRIWPSEKERHHQEEQKNFSLIVTQQYKPLRGLDAKRFDALQKAYAIDIVYFLNSHELIHAELGKLNFYHDFRMEIKGDFLVNTEGYYDIYSIR